MADSELTTKRCARCDSRKSVELFSGDKKRPDGRYPTCKQCVSTRARLIHSANPQAARARWRRWADAHADQLRHEREASYAKNGDKIRARSRAWHAANTQRAHEAYKKWYAKNRNRVIADRRRWIAAHPGQTWYANNKAITADRIRRWRIENPERYREQWKRAALANPDRTRAKQRKAEQTRRARKIGAFIEVVDPLVVYERDGGVCGICQRQIAKGHTWHIDHKVPLAKGGTHGYDNVQLAHALCNQSKGAKMPVGQINLFQKKAG